MHGFVDPCFEETPGGGANIVRRGEIYEDQPVYLPARHALEISNIDPAGYNADFTVVGRSSRDLFDHLPLKSPINLPHGEALIVAKAKWTRPVIVVSAAAGSELSPNSGASFTKTYLCAPIYGCDQFPRDLIERLRAYEFPNLFYLPKCSRPRFDEGFIRLDHMQAIDKTKLQNRRGRLASDAMDFFDEWLRYYTTGVLADDGLVNLYRSEIPQP